MAGSVNAETGTEPNAGHLEQELRSLEPAVRLIRERYLRAILHALADDGVPVPINPERPLWVAVNQLRELEILPEEQLAGARGDLLLLTEPSDRLPFSTPFSAVRLHYGQLLVQAWIIRFLRDRIEDRRLSVEQIESRLARLGQVAVRELQFVLERDHTVVRGAGLEILYPVFAAVYLAHARFQPHLLPWLFPSLPPAEVTTRLLAEDVNLTSLLPPDTWLEAPVVGGPPEPVEEEEPAEESTPLALGALSQAAERAAGRGNRVRAAILLQRAALRQAGSGGEPLAVRARLELEQGLLDPLTGILGWTAEERESWRSALNALLVPASRGLWPRAARALYDLQKLAHDLSGELYAVNPIGWARSLGCRPLRRPLTRARVVVRLGHLRAALRHALRVPLDAAIRERIQRLFEVEIHRATAEIRGEFGPVIRKSFDAVGLRPSSVPEATALDKLIAELEDRVCDRGFLRFADLRDAVARNQLKLPDLSNPVELIGGDDLLRVDSRLGEELDGVYRRGEFYLRWLQRITATAFGTRTGRWLSKYVVFPFGGAFLIVEFAKYLVYEMGKLQDLILDLFGKGPLSRAIPPGGELASAGSGGHGTAVTPGSIAATLILGLLILGLLHSPPFRALVGRGLSHVWSGIVFLFVRLPRAIWHWPPVRVIRRSPVVRFLVRHTAPAVAFAGIVAVVLVALGADGRRIGLGAGIGYLIALVIHNTPVGRRMWDETAESFSDAWRDIRVNLIPGLVSWVMSAFRTLVNLVERGLYAIDEWFRFREGQSGGSLGLKVILAVVWFPVEYLFRFAFYLLLEPQVNPLKHFPVVTVSHKLLLPSIGIIAEATGLPVGVVTILIWCIPGIFGFIAWELKENWRLYAANRQAGLPRVVLGHHGETMRRLLRPGFHSGTVPSLFRRFRTATERSERTGRPVKWEKFERGLAEVRHAVKQFLDRELLALLGRSGGWVRPRLQVATVHVGVQSITAEVVPVDTEQGPLRITFEHIAGSIVSQVEVPDWVDRLPTRQQAVLQAAVAGICEMADARPPSHKPIAWEDWVAFWNTTSQGQK